VENSNLSLIKIVVIVLRKYAILSLIPSYPRNNFQKALFPSQIEVCSYAETTVGRGMGRNIKYEIWVRYVHMLGVLSVGPGRMPRRSEQDSKTWA
jgi:hypothetical protein